MMTTGKWRLMLDGPCDGGANMAADLALLRACAEGTAPPTVRLYGWSAPTLSIGYAQDTDADIDVERCRRLNIPVVRRPTGGGAVLHHHELTYCLVAPVPHPLFPGNPRGAFRAVSRMLLDGLEELGIQGQRAAIAGARAVSLLSPVCFSACNRHEITVDGRKLIGSAQRRRRSAFLQHGSVLLDFDREFLNSLFVFKSEEARGQSLDRLMQSTISLREACRRPVAYAEAAAAFAAGFRRALGSPA